jgi:hypothetical protein
LSRLFVRSAPTLALIFSPVRCASIIAVTAPVRGISSAPVLIRLAAEKQPDTAPACSGSQRVHIGGSCAEQARRSIGAACQLCLIRCTASPLKACGPQHDLEAQLGEWAHSENGEIWMLSSPVTAPLLLLWRSDARFVTHQSCWGFVSCFSCCCRCCCCCHPAGA